MKTSPNDISNIELLGKIEGLIESSKVETYEAIQELAQHMDERFATKEDLMITKEDLMSEMVTKDELKSELSRFATKEDLMATEGELKSAMEKQQTRMVTKDYLDDKLADHHSAIILHTQREIEKALG